MKFDGYLFVVFLALFHITFCSKVFETKIDRLNQHHETDDGLAREKRVEQDVKRHDARALTKRNESQAKIVGGSFAAKGEFPWIVSIRRGATIFCGGSLVNKRWVLTAAHCFRPNESPDRITIAAGDCNLVKKDEGEVKIKVCAIYPHPEFINKYPFHHDIALLMLCEEVVRNPNVQFVSLQPKSMSLPISSNVTVAGWGRVQLDGRPSQILKKAHLKTIELSSCNHKYYGSLTANQFCAGSIKNGNYVGSCRGDSGGPLTYQTRGKTYQVGVVSFGGCVGEIAVYTNVANYRGWIAGVW